MREPEPYKSLLFGELLGKNKANITVKFSHFFANPDHFDGLMAIPTVFAGQTVAVVEFNGYARVIVMQRFLNLYDRSCAE